MKHDADNTTSNLGWALPAPVIRLALALLLALTGLVWWQAWLSFQQGLAVVFVDVGQGDSIIVHAPSGRSLLIDGGGSPFTPTGSQEIGQWAVVPALYREGIKRLDAIIVTHAHDDHVGGLTEVIGQVPVGMILGTADARPTPNYDKLLEAAKEKKIPVIQAKAGQIFNLGGGITAEALYPASRPASQPESDANNSSTVIKLSYKQISFLFTGDLPQEQEAELSGASTRLAGTVLKVPHHGSRDSLNSAFLSAVRPAWAVISVGAGNSFGHPDGQTLEKLRAAKTKVFRTDEMGTIVMHTNGRRLEADWEKKGFHQHAELK